MCPVRRSFADWPGGAVVGGRWCTIVLRPLGGPPGLPTIGLSHHPHYCHRCYRHHNQCHGHHCHHHHHHHSTPTGGRQGSSQIRVSHACWVEETLSNFTITRESKTFVSGKDTLCQPMLWVGTALIMGLKCKQIRNQFWKDWQKNYFFILCVFMMCDDDYDNNNDDCDE